MQHTSSEPAATSGIPRGAAVDRRIRAATLQVLRERGYRDLTMEGVAAAAGVAKTSVYRRFQSRAALVGAVLAELATGGAPRPARDGDGPPTAAELLATGRRVTGVLTDPVAAGAVLGVLLEADDAGVAAVRRSLVVHPAPAAPEDPGLDSAGSADAVRGSQSDTVPTSDPSTDAVAGAVLLRTLVLRLPVDEDYLHALVDRLRPAADTEENP